jgi:hypothetical protein
MRGEVRIGELRQATADCAQYGAGAGPSGLVVGLDRDRFQGTSSPGLTGCSPGTLMQRVLAASPRKIKYAR